MCLLSHEDCSLREDSRWREANPECSSALQWSRTGLVGFDSVYRLLQSSLCNRQELDPYFVSGVEMHDTVRVM